MIFCHMTAGNGAIFRTHRQTNEHTSGWTDRRGNWNSYLDFPMGYQTETYVYNECRLGHSDDSD